jgi:succinate dehydrogenase / fumarate reductase, cytochrome b subunit
MLAIYVIAMIATTWHFSYGIWLFAAKWGITPGDRARKRFGYVCGIFGTALCIMGLASIYAIVWMYPNAPANAMPPEPAAVLVPTSSIQQVEQCKLHPELCRPDASQPSKALRE